MSDKKSLKDRVKEVLPGIKKLLEFQEEAKFVEQELADGSKITFDPEMAPGAKASVIDASGNAIDAEGEYILKDGTKVLCKDGAVDSIEPAETQMDKDVEALAQTVAAQDQALTQMRQAFAAMTKSSESMKEKISALTKAVTDTLGLVQELSEAPAATPAQQEQKFSADHSEKPKDKISRMVNAHLDAINK